MFTTRQVVQRDDERLITHLPLDNIITYPISPFISLTVIFAVFIYQGLRDWKEIFDVSKDENLQEDSRCASERERCGIGTYVQSMA